MILGGYMYDSLNKFKMGVGYSYHYDFQAQAWTKYPDMPESRAEAACTSSPDGWGLKITKWNNYYPAFKTSVKSTLEVVTTRTIFQSRVFSFTTQKWERRVAGWTFRMKLSTSGLLEVIKKFISGFDFQAFSTRFVMINSRLQNELSKWR